MGRDGKIIYERIKQGNVAESFKKLNPDLFRANPHAGIRAEKSEPIRRGQCQDSGMVQGAAEIHYSIRIIVCRKRLLDSHDNAAASCKQVTDFITRALGFASDDDPRLKWTYHQFKGPNTGTTIIIDSTTQTV